MTKSQAPLFLIVVIGVSVLASEKCLRAQDSVRVTVVGTIRTGIFAIGGETTGTIINAKNISRELDFGKNVAFRITAEKPNRKKGDCTGDA